MAPSPISSKFAASFRLAAALAAFLCVCALLLFTHGKHTLDDALGYGVLPATQSLLHGNGLTICSDELAKTPGSHLCFHAARMPMAEWVVALGIRLFGNHLLSVLSFKIILFLLPLLLAIYLVYSSVPVNHSHRNAALLLLLIPFTILPLLMDIVRVDFEEAYSYSFIALAFAFTFFLDKVHARLSQNTLLTGILAALCAGAIFLSKSSMSLFALSFILLFTYRTPSPRVRALTLLISLAAPAGWMLYQHHAGGRYSAGTSLDGFNLHMGNSEQFLRDYPPHAGTTLDDTASELNSGHIFANEWAFNDFHKQAAMTFIETHPKEALIGELRKLDIIFLTTRVIGVSTDRGALALIARLGFILFRLIFLWALLSAIYSLFRPNLLPRQTAATFLLFIAVITLPYAAGFAYTRHLTILIFPACIFCCRLLLTRGLRPPL